MKVLGDDGGVPRAAGGCDHASDEVREDSREDEPGPTLPASEFVNGCSLLEVGRDGDSAGNDVKEDVPLCSQQHESDGADAETPAQTDEAQKQDREQGRCRNRGHNLDDGLEKPGQFRIETNCNANGNGPERCDEQGGVDAEIGGSCAQEQKMNIRPGDAVDNLECSGKPPDGRQTSKNSKKNGENATAFGGCIVNGLDDPAFAGAREAVANALFQRAPSAGGYTGENAWPLKKREDGRGHAGGGFDLLEFKFVAPRDQRTPNQLIGGHNDRDQDRQSPEQRMSIDGVGGGCGLQVAA